MARIPQTELDRLKAEVSVEELARGRGVQFVRKGTDLHGRCPFHEDRTPSLVVTPEKNVWHCLGACQTGGSAIDWVMKAEGVSFRHAVELLRANLPGGSGEPADEIPALPPTMELPRLASTEVEDQELLRRVVGFYHETLQMSPEALGYLEKRGLTHPDLVDRFRLGFCNRTLGYKLPDGGTQEGAEIRGRLRDLGILRESGHEHLRGSLTVPLYDAAGNLVQMYGRKISRDLRKGTPLHLYLPAPQRGVFNLEGIRDQEEVILCESLLDALTFWSAGLTHVTTSYGVGGPNPELWEILTSGKTKRVLLAYDADEAGDEGARKLAEKLQARGLAPYRVRFPRGMDVNEYALKVTPAAKSLALALHDAVWMSQGKAPERDLERQLETTQEEAPQPSPPASPGSDEPAPKPEAATKEGTARVASPSLGSPPSPSSSLLLERRGENYWATLGDRSYRIRTFFEKSSPSALRVNLQVSRERELGGRPALHVDTLDLYLDKARGFFGKRAAQELGVPERVLREDLVELLLALQEVARQESRDDEEEETVEVPADERAEALELLQAPDLLDRILLDFRRCGIVGEETNKLVGYLAAVSRKLEMPLAVVIQSSSAAGKSSLMDAVLAFMPEEERVTYSAMTGQSLFYMSESNLRHKILAISEEEGAQRASYALKLLQSEGELTIASTGKDPVTGRLVTQEYRVEGPVMIFLTTTATEMDEELLNRCLVLTVDEGREQTRAIHKLQRERQTLEGLLESKEREEILKRHHNAQRLLEPLLVANPYANELTFLDHQTRMRRDHMKYLTLIRSIALLHQHQREVKTARTASGLEVRYIEVTREDIATANRLAQEVLGRSLDELPPQTRRLLDQVVEIVAAKCQEQGVAREDYRFTRRDVREWTGVGNTQAKIHLGRLEDLEYLLVHSGGRGQSLVYELLYEPEEGDSPRLSGLLDLGEPRGNYGYDREWSGVEGEWSGSSRGQVGPKSGGCRGWAPTNETGSQKDLEKDSPRRIQQSGKKALPGARIPPVVVVPHDADAA